MRNEIDNYLREMVENKDKFLEMSDCPMGSTGAIYVSNAVSTFEHVQEMQLSNCEIPDPGA